jgi:hypothetical protein
LNKPGYDYFSEWIALQQLFEKPMPAFAFVTIDCTMHFQNLNDNYEK